MFRTLPIICLLLTGWNSVTTTVSAQDMRVYTTVSELTNPGSAPRVLSHSLTLFHAGKVYDYMEEAGEVVIYEPVHHRFVILGKNYLATEVPFSEVNHSLDVTKSETTRMLEQMRNQGDERSLRLASLVEFQFAPEFETTLNEAEQRFVMQAEPLQYTVKTSRVESPQCIQQYLDYADWAARLNFVLRRNATFPAARLKLNDSLRQAQLLPTQVDLQFQQGPRAELMRFRADHQFSWEFQSVDRRLISHWERELRSNNIRWLSFPEYQQQLVAKRDR